MKPYRGKGKAGWLKVLAALILVGALTFGGLLGAVLHGSVDRVNGQPEVMVILGCQVKPWGPSVLLQDRLDEALDYLEEHPEMTVVVSGSQGRDEPMSEAQAMYEYLVAHGIDEARILQEDRSRNTMENLEFTKKLLEERGYDIDGDMVVVSNGFHLTRVRMLWGRVFGSGENLSTLAAPASHAPSRLKMYIREPLALMKSFLLDR